MLEGNIQDFGDATRLEAGFECRSITGRDIQERTGPWTATEPATRSASGVYRRVLRGLPPGTYEVHADFLIITSYYLFSFQILIR